MVFLRTLIFCAAIVLFSCLEAKQTVCLNMIVKNETPVIKRCLDSTRPMIDYWVIVDTGSTDGTQKLIKEVFKDIPGELHERPWVNFEHNRNEALKFAEGKADYVLFIDADEYFSYEPDFKLPNFDKDSYNITMSYGAFNYARTQLINNHLPWQWKGVLHEVLIPKPENAHRTQGDLEGVKRIVVGNEGARSQDPNKYKKDAAVLEAALKTEPNNTRYVFYLGRSYNDAGEHALALKTFEKRIAMGGWDEEVFESMLDVAHIHEQIGSPHETVINAYQKAFSFRPSRVEPLYFLTRYLRNQGDYKRAYDIAKVGVSVPLSKDLLFVQPWLYDYGMQLELSACAYWIERYEECQKISQELLKNERISPANRAVVEKNLEFTNIKLVEKAAA